MSCFFFFPPNSLAEAFPVLLQPLPEHFLLGYRILFIGGFPLLSVYVGTQAAGTGVLMVSVSRGRWMLLFSFKVVTQPDNQEFSTC